MLSDIDQLKNLCDEYLSKGLFTHVSIRCGQFEPDRPGFQFDFLPGGEDLFDLASLTKALVTVPLIFRHLERSNLNLKTSTLEDFCGGTISSLSPALLNLKIADILSHRSGLPWWRPLWITCGLEKYKNPQLSKQDLEIKLAQYAREITPCGKPVYSDIGFILLGYLIEQVEQKNLKDVFFDFCERDLKTSSLSEELCFCPEGELKARSISTGFSGLRGYSLKGEVHDDNSWALGGISGHAGLFGSGAGVEKFLRSLFVSSLGRRIFAAQSTLLGAENSILYGFHQGSGESAALFGGGKAMGHLGFTGTAFWVKSDKPHFGILLTNRVISGFYSKDITTFRRKAFALMDSITNRIK